MVTAPQVAPRGTRSLPSAPSLIVGTVHHTRYRPLKHSFTTRHHSWLIDLDSPPQLPIWLRHITFDPRDHLSGPETLSDLKANVLRCAERAGLGCPGETRVLMLAHPRVAGHTFNPMTAYWCVSAGVVHAVVVEVHNTYGGRHAYVVSGADAEAGTRLEKAFYVSPFNDVSGMYAVRVRASARHIAVSIALEQDGERTLIATLSGRVEPLTRRTLASVLVRDPLMPQRVSAQIRVHGIWLWLRRLPVRSRPDSTLETVR